MTSTKNNVVALSPKNGGGAFWSDTVTQPPTDSTTPLVPDFVSLGLVTDAGAVENRNWTSSNVTEWGGQTVKVLQSEFGVTYEITFLEALNPEVQKLVNGDANVTATPATTGKGNLLAVKVNADVLPTKQYVFDLMDGKVSGRVVIPAGQVTNIAAVTNAKTATKNYQVTLTCFPDDSGNNVYEYYDDGVGEAGSSSSSSAAA